MVDAREDVEQRPLGRRREADAVGDDGRHAERGGERDERGGVGFFIAAEMALQLEIDVAAAEDADEAIEQPAHAVAPPVERGAPREHDEPARAAVELLERQRALALRRAQLHPRDQPAEISVARPGFRRGRGG